MCMLMVSRITKGIPKAYGISERSGMRFPLSEMIREPGTGFFIHRLESDQEYNAVDHPQAHINKYARFDDPKPIVNPRPDRNWAAALQHTGASNIGASLYTSTFATKGYFGISNITGNVTVTAAAELKEVYFGVVNITGSASTTATGYLQHNGIVVSTSTGTVTTTATRTLPCSSSITGTASTTNVGALHKYGSSSLSANCTVSAAAQILIIHNGESAISATATVTSSTSLGFPGASTINGTAAVSSAGVRLLKGVVTSTGSGTASANSSLISKTRLLYSFEDTPPATDYSTKVTTTAGAEVMARLLNADTTMSLTRTTDNTTNGTYSWRALHVESGGTTNTATILVADSLTVNTVNPSTGFDLTGYTTVKLDYYVASATGDDGVTIRFYAISDVTRSSVTGDLVGTTGSGTLSVSLTGAFDESNVKLQITVTADDDAGGLEGSGFDIYFDNVRAE